MNHRKKTFKLDLMTTLLIVVSLGVALTMIAQASGQRPRDSVVAVYHDAS